MHPEGWTEISAVCTDQAWRGRGLASRLTRAVAAVIVTRGEKPFLHAVAANTGAIRLYTELGFRLRRTTVFSAARVPETQPVADERGRGPMPGRWLEAVHRVDIEPA